MMETVRYNLKEFTDISFSNFNYNIPDESFTIINYLCSQVGSQELLSNKFTKSNIQNSNEMANENSLFKNTNSKKRRGNKGMEINSEDWESIRSFQATKIEQKSGIDGDIDQIRLLLNKLTDRSYLDMREKIFEKIDNIVLQNSQEDDVLKLGNMIYEISSTNKFYSKIFADLFSELIKKYSWLNEIFDEKISNINELYTNIQYFDANVDYDKYCDMNKINEKRKSVTTFFVNLSLNGLVPNGIIIKTLSNLLELIMSYIGENDKKNEVDELTENIAILFNKDIMRFEGYKESDYLINDLSILDTITKLAKCKTKDYTSLSNKAIFKYMDLIEI